MEEYLLITNDQNKYDIEQLGEETQELRENIKIVDSQELKKLKKKDLIFHLSDRKYQLQDLLKVENLNICLCPSPIYENVYYDIACFDRYYIEDTEEIIQLLAGFMGAKRCEIKFVSKEEYKAKYENNFEADLNINYTLYAKGEANYKQTDLDKSSNFKELQKNEMRTSENGLSGKLTKEELQKYIEEHHIYIEKLPTSFKSALKAYLKTGEVRGQSVSKKYEKINQDIEKQSIKSGSIKAQIVKLPLNIGTKFDYQKTSNESSLRDCLVEYFIDFGD
ncbi:hypothetical protein BXA13_04860 [Campylobacter lari]|uniref:Uncharacterized protein n=1 Tax=Campylobacter lari TaxID=201 RepID=A0A7U8BHS6_CAMLA|nr:hypothetical protein [Campylobacter lari]